MNSDEESIINHLPERQKAVVKYFGDRAISLITEKLKDGYKIVSCTGDGVEMKQGFSYRYISRGGSSYAL